MAVSFASVTDVKIPQGNVVKIHEASSGRVLWQKNTSGYNTKTKVELIEGFATLSALSALSGFRTSTSISGKELLIAPMLATNPYYNKNSQSVFNNPNVDTQFAYSKPSRINTWFKSGSLDKTKIKHVKWFIDTKNLPPYIDLRYYEEGSKGVKGTYLAVTMGDNFDFAFFIKSNKTVNISGYALGNTTIDGVTAGLYYWAKVKIVTNIGYDEKYIPFWVGKDTITASGNTLLDYDTVFYKNSTVAPDISQSSDL